MGNSCSQAPPSTVSSSQKLDSPMKLTNQNNSTTSTNNSDNGSAKNYNNAGTPPPPQSAGSSKLPPIPPAEDDDRRALMTRAASKIQRHARRTRAMRSALREQQWRLFADLDTQDEAEMLQLAVFMQTLIDTVPHAGGHGKGAGGGEALRSEETASPQAQLDGELHITLDSIQMSLPPSAKQPAGSEGGVFEIGTREVDRDLAYDLVEAVRGGVRLSRAS
eukprot:gene41199-50274_t